MALESSLMRHGKHGSSSGEIVGAVQSRNLVVSLSPYEFGLGKIGVDAVL